MSDYSRQVDFTAKDALSPGDPAKLIKGVDVDSEFDAILTAVNSKYDSNDIASIAEAQAASDNTVLITPSRLGSWADANAGIVGDIQALADPGADRILGWDDSASAAIGFSLGTGLGTSGTALQLDFLGLESLTDPGADRIAFWDDSSSTFNWLVVSAADFDLSGTTLSLASTIASQTITTLTSTTINLDGGAMTANANSVLEWGNQPIAMHQSTSYESAEIWFSTSAPTTQGENGDIWFQYS